MTGASAYCEQCGGSCSSAEGHRRRRTAMLESFGRALKVDGARIESMIRVSPERHEFEELLSAALRDSDRGLTDVAKAHRMADLLASMVRRRAKS